MKRVTVVFVSMAMLVIFAACAFAVHTPEPEEIYATPADPAPAEDMDHGMMMGMTAAVPDIAAWDGHIYLLTGMKLEKLDGNLQPVRTVEFEHMPAETADHDHEAAAPQQEAAHDHDAAAPEQEAGGMMGQQRMQMMQRMHAMHRGRTLANARVSADASGVYVLRGQTLTVYDHDLNELRSAQVMDMPARAMDCPMCPMMMERMQRDRPMMGRGMMGRGMMAPEAWGEAIERQLTEGTVRLYQRPHEPALGQMTFRVEVQDAEGQPDHTASVTGFLYPEGQTDRGRTIAFTPDVAGIMTGTAQIRERGDHWLAVRIIRPGHEDAVVYYPISVMS